jgi:tetratricopeptide (TPR) repeat protein
MSPEQAAGRGDVGPATDIYSLGGILYAILTGQPPMPRALAPVLLLNSVDRTPPAPHLVKKGVPIGLEAVCLKSMASQPADRYSGADELAREVQRWLADEPVAARGEPLLERWGRWSRRHRSLVSGLTALLLAGLVGLAVGLWAVSREQARTALQRDEARTAKLQAEESRDLAEKAQAEAEDNFKKANHALAEAKSNLEQADRNLLLARRAVEECFVLTAREPLLSQEAAAPLRRRLLKAALPYYREFRTSKPDDPAFDMDLARNLTRVAEIEVGLGDRAEGRAHVERARELCLQLARLEGLSGDQLQSVSDCINDVGSVYHALGEFATAAQVLAEARRLQERLVKQRPKDFRARFHLAKMAHNLGVVERNRGRVREALQSHEEALKLEADLLKSQPDNAELIGHHVATWRGKASLLAAEERLDEAHKAFLKGEQFGERLMKLKPLTPENVRTVATTYSDHAAMQSNRGKPGEALPLFQKAVALQEMVCRKVPESRYLHDLGIMNSNLGRVNFLLRKPDDELAAWDRARRVWADVLARRPKDEEAGKHHHEAWRQWIRAKVFRVERLMGGGDAVGSAREIEQIASETQQYKPSLLTYAAVCGRWLSTFAKSDRVSASQRDAVSAQALAFLRLASREGMLNDQAKERLKTDRAFDALRGNAAFKKLAGEDQVKKEP